MNSNLSVSYDLSNSNRFSFSGEVSVANGNSYNCASRALLCVTMKASIPGTTSETILSINMSSLAKRFNVSLCRIIILKIVGGLFGIQTVEKYISNVVQRLREDKIQSLKLQLKQDYAQENPPKVSKFEFMLFKLENEENAPEKIIENFWKKLNQKQLKHGTSSIYLQHFKTHGISAHYPEKLAQCVDTVRKLWSDHSQEIRAKKGHYFKDIEDRLDEARSKERKIAISFSDNPETTQEYTFGSGRGGELSREVKPFLKATIDMFKNQPEKRKSILQLKALWKLMHIMPPMTLSIPLGSEEFPFILSINSLRQYIKRECPLWNNQNELFKFLSQLYMRIESMRPNAELLRKTFYVLPSETIVTKPIAAENIQFETLEEQQYDKESMDKDYPIFDFNQRLIVDAKTTAKLNIYSNGFTLCAGYEDSKFVCRYLDNNQYEVERKRLTQQEKSERDHWIAEMQLERALTQEWIEYFGCGDLINERSLDPFKFCGSDHIL